MDVYVYCLSAPRWRGQGQLYLYAFILGHPSSLLKVSNQNSVHIFIAPVRATFLTHLVILDLIVVIFGEEYKLSSLSSCSFLHSPVTSSLIYLLNTLVSNTHFLHCLTLTVDALPSSETSETVAVDAVQHLERRNAITTVVRISSQAFPAFCFSGRPNFIVVQIIGRKKVRRF